MRVERASLARLADAQLLLGEYYEAIGVVQRDTPEAVRGFLSAAGGAALWIAYQGRVPAGCVVLRPLATPAQAAECKRLWVRPGFRGQGVAGRLLDALEAFALASGRGAIYLDSKDDLADALRLYLRRGYRACGRYNENPQATLFLCKKLGAGAAG